MKAKAPQYIYRSAETGKIVGKKFALANLSTTTREKKPKTDRELLQELLNSASISHIKYGFDKGRVSIVLSTRLYRKIRAAAKLPAKPKKAVASKAKKMTNLVTAAPSFIAQ